MATTSYPNRHISIRVPWHDTGWNWHVHVRDVGGPLAPSTKTHSFRRDPVQLDSITLQFPPPDIAATLVDNNQVEEATRERLEKTKTMLIFGERLKDREIHLPALDNSGLDLVPGITEGRVRPWAINENVAIDTARAAMLARMVPARRPQLPAIRASCQRAGHSPGGLRFYQVPE